jgi:hypothetical protein
MRGKKTVHLSVWHPFCVCVMATLFVTLTEDSCADHINDFFVLTVNVTVNSDEHSSLFFTP